MAAALAGLAISARRFSSAIFSRRYVRYSAIRFLQTSQVRQSLDQEFEQARNNLNTLKDDPGNTVKLNLYALFKQASVGKCNTKQPSMIDFVGKAKWTAWTELGGMSQDDAKKKYIDTIQSLLPQSTSTAEAAAQPAAADRSNEDFATSVEDKVHVLRFNRPAKKNAITTQMYLDIAASLKRAAEDDTVIAVLTGTGDTYCSGNDLSNFTQINPANLSEESRKGGDLLSQFVKAFVDFPKPLIALVNGPALGVSVTTLGLCDIVYASDKATFQTPFTQLGQTPEGCSSVIFPRLMGHSRAAEMMLFNKKLTAAEACERGLVTEVIPDQDFQKEAWARVREMSQLPPQTLHIAKKLIRDIDRKLLHETVEKECDILVERWQSDECMDAIMNFFNRKSKI